MLLVLAATEVESLEIDESFLLSCSGTTKSMRFGGNITGVIDLVNGNRPTTATVNTRGRHSSDDFIINIAESWIRKNNEDVKKISGLKVEPLAITGSYRTAFLTKGRINVDRVSGSISIKSIGSEYSGDCAVVDAVERKIPDPNPQ